MAANLLGFASWMNFKQFERQLANDGSPFDLATFNTQNAGATADAFFKFSGK